MSRPNFNLWAFSLLALATIAHINLSLTHPTLTKRAPAVVMGLAESFGAIAHTTLTSTGNTVIIGDCGTYPGTAITGFPPGACTGTTSAGGTAAQNAEASCLTA